MSASMWLRLNHRSALGNIIFIGLLDNGTRLYLDVLYANEGIYGLNETLSYDDQMFIGAIEARWKAWQK